jgi:Holliday junction resolvasome RuvABC endonuclease subunit
MNRVLGLDPGYAAKTGLGWAVVDVGGIRPTLVAHGVEQTSAAWPWEVRLAELGRRLRGVIDLHSIEGLAVEDISGAVRGAQKTRVATTTDRRTQVTGDGWLLLAGALGIPYALVPPSEWRKAVVGTGRCEKEAVRDALVRLVGFPPRGALHASDATAIAIAGGRRLALEAKAGKWAADGQRVVRLPVERASRARDAAASSRRTRKQLTLASLVERRSA